eukprot:gene50779-67982_t
MQCRARAPLASTLFRAEALPSLVIAQCCPGRVDLLTRAKHLSLAGNLSQMPREDAYDADNPAVSSPPAARRHPPMLFCCAAACSPQLTSSTYADRPSPCEASSSALAVPTPEVRTHLTPVCKRATALESQSPNLEKRLLAARRWLERQAQSQKALVFSDENIIGNCASIFDRQSIYATALPRLTRLAEALDGHEVRIWLCVRDYSSFL